MNFILQAGLSGPHTHAALHRAFSLPQYRHALPEKLYVDGKERTDTANWQEAISTATREADAFWDPHVQQLGVVLGIGMVTVCALDAFSRAGEGVALIDSFPFELVSLGSVFPDQWDAAGYRRWTFARRHLDHGWGCAFRGTGHDRLHSRRWLDFGPWRVIRRPNDTTFIQFHDLAVTDPAEAYEQAKIGHQRMGIDPIGGFIQGIDTTVLEEVEGLYRPETKALEIIVAPGIEITQQQMRVACGLRLHHRLTKPMVDRIEKIAYVFAAKEDARAHLHELWLRELECWYLDETGKHRMDLDYEPIPQPPAWVREVEARGD